MGLSKSKTHVLVVGLSGSGKTHFLDSLLYGVGSTALPTHGFYQVSYRDLVFTEYGGSIDWLKTLQATHHSFNAVYLVIRSTFSIELVCESNNALLMLDRHFEPGIPFCILWNGGESANRLTFKPGRPFRQHCVDFENPLWLEGVWELFEWTTSTASLNSATRS